jgi:hypothetical protein
MAFFPVKIQWRLGNFEIPLIFLLNFEFTGSITNFKAIFTDLKSTSLSFYLFETTSPSLYISANIYYH